MLTFENCDIAYPMPEAVFSVKQSRHLNDIQPYKQLQACHITNFSRASGASVYAFDQDFKAMHCWPAKQLQRRRSLPVLSAESFIWCSKCN